jgi:hypothetical protein
MAVIYLKHDTHGAKMEAEAVADEANGWVRYNPETPTEEVEAAPVNALEVKRRRKSE